MPDEEELHLFKLDEALSAVFFVDFRIKNRVLSGLTAEIWRSERS